MRVLPVAVIVLLGVLAWLLLRGDGRNDVVDIAAAQSAAESESVSAPALVPVVTPTRVASGTPRGKRSSGHLPLREGGNETERPDYRTILGSPTIPIEGIVIVVDAKGTHHWAEDGSFEPSFSGDASGHRNAPVPVTRGRFHLDCPPDSGITIRHLVLGGHAARVEKMPPGGLEIHVGAPVAVRAHWIKPIALRAASRPQRIANRRGGGG